MATGKTQTYESFGDYERLAQFFKDYETGWRVVFDIVAPIHGSLLGVSQLYAGSLALIVLTYYIARYDIESALKHFLLLVVFVVMTFPMTVNNVGGWGTGDEAGRAKRAAQGSSTENTPVRVSMFLYYFDQATTRGLAVLQESVDKGIAKHGKAGDFGAPVGVIASMSKAYTDFLKNSELKTAYDDYNNKCSHVASGLSQDEATSVGLLGGPLGNKAWVFSRITESKNATDALKRSILANGAYIRPDGYYLESSAYWDDRLKRTVAQRDKKPTVSFLSNEKRTELNSLQYQPANTIPAGKEAEYKFRFFAVTCYDLYRIADAGMQEYNSGLNQNYSTTGSLDILSGGAPASMVPNGKAFLSSSLGQYYLYQLLHTDAADRTGEASNLYRSAMGTGGAIGGALGTFYNWWAELKLQYFAVLVPGIATATSGIIFVLFPIAALIGLFPNRGSLISNSLYGLVFVKLCVFLAYLILMFGGLLSTAAIEVMVNSMSYGGTNLAATIIPWVIGGQALTMIATIALPPVVSYMLVFNETSGLKSLRFDKYGAQQLAATAATIATVTTKGGAMLMPKGGGGGGGPGTTTQPGSPNTSTVNGRRRGGTINGTATRAGRSGDPDQE